MFCKHFIDISMKPPTHAAVSWNRIVKMERFNLLPDALKLFMVLVTVVYDQNHNCLSVCLSVFANHKHSLSFTENPSADQWKWLWGFCPGGNQPWSISNLPLCVLNASHTLPLLVLSIPVAWHWQNPCTFPRRTYQKSERGCTESCATVSWVRRPNEGSRLVRHPPAAAEVTITHQQLDGAGGGSVCVDLVWCLIGFTTYLNKRYVVKNVSDVAWSSTFWMLGSLPVCSIFYWHCLALATHRPDFALFDQWMC